MTPAVPDTEAGHWREEAAFRWRLVRWAVSLWWQAARNYVLARVER